MVLRRQNRAKTFQAWRVYGCSLLVGASLIGQASALEAGSEDFRLELQLGHTKSITQLDFSHDGRHLVSSSEDESIKVWDVPSGRLLRTLDGHQARVRAAAFEPGSNALVSVSMQPETRADSMIKRWDPLGGTLKKAVTWRKRRGQRRDIWSFTWAGEKGRIITAGAMDEVAIWDTVNGTHIATLKPSKKVRRSSSRVRAEHIVVVGDGSYAISGHKNGMLVVWDLEKGKEVSRTARIHRRGVASLDRFQGSQGTLISLSGDGRVFHWRVNLGVGTLELLEELSGGGSRAIGLVSDSRVSYLTGHINGEIRRWKKARSKSSTVQRGLGVAIEAMAVSNNGSLLAVAYKDHTIRIVDLASGRVERTMRGELTDVWSVAVSPSQKEMVMGTGAGSIHVWNLETGSVAKTLGVNKKPVGVLEFSPDGAHFLSAGAGGTTAPAQAESTVRLWDTRTRRQIGKFHQGFLVGAQFGDAGRTVVVGGSYMGKTGVRTWRLEDGKSLGEFTLCEANEGMSKLCDLDGFVVSSAAKEIVARRSDGTLQGFSHEDGRLRFDTSSKTKSKLGAGQFGARLSSSMKVLSMAKLASRDRRHRVWGGAMGVHPDGETFAVGRQDKRVAIHRWSDGKRVKYLRGHQGWVRSVKYSPEGNWLVSGGEDKAALVWEVSSGKEVSRLIGHVGAVWDVEFSQGTDFVWSSGGDGTVRLWSNEEEKLLATLVSNAAGEWAVTTPQGHFDAADLETISTLHWVKGSRVAPLEAFMRDYYEPKLLNKLLSGEVLRTVKDINLLNIDSPEIVISKIKPNSRKGDLVDVEVSFSSPSGECAGPNSSRVPNGTFDVRLFRNRKMVAYKDGRIDEARVLFKGIRLPKDGERKVTFSAYGFNCDRVKSRTDFKVYRSPKQRPNRPGRTYIVSMGVNAFEASEWNLTYAVNDAKLFQKVLPKVLSNNRPKSLVSVGLYSDVSSGTEGPLPTKENLKILFETLGGKKLTSKAKKERPWLTQIRPVRPEDRVVVTFATHGFRTQDGGFYLFPSDTGASKGRGGLPRLERLVSAAELELWFRDIDAQEFIMVIDACNSAASVQQEGFKPGPMGSRGLGQLAFNKGMRIIAASQGNEPAKENASLEHGLLTYSLVWEGIEAKWADHDPKDGAITASEWLAYGSSRVPSLDKEARRGRIKPLPAGQSLTRGLSLMVNGKRKKRKRVKPIQQPQVFDFARGTKTWFFGNGAL